MCALSKNPPYDLDFRGHEGTFTCAEGDGGAPVLDADGVALPGESKFYGQVIDQEILGWKTVAYPRGLAWSEMNWKLCVEGKSGKRMWIRYLENKWRRVW